MNKGFKLTKHGQVASNAPHTRQAILNAAHNAGISNGERFAQLCVSLGMSRSHAYGYWSGKSDYTGEKIDKLIEYFGLEIATKKRRPAK